LCVVHFLIAHLIITTPLNTNKTTKFCYDIIANATENVKQIGKTAGFINVRKNSKLADYMKSRCPVCDKVIDEATRQDSRDVKFYPFCSDRCKLIDLGKWFDGNYRIAVQANEEEESGEGEQAPKANNQDKTEND
jgi:endogenous inhibitor of DNA gyrase (YacG/DUF329 family)